MTTATAERPRSRPIRDRRAGRPHSYKKPMAESIAVTCGVALIGYYDVPAFTLADVLADVLAWHADASFMVRKGLMDAREPWPWEPGEDVVMSHAGRVLAFVRQHPDGSASVTRVPD